MTRVAFFLGLTIVAALGATIAASVGAPPAVFAGALALAFLGFAGASAASAVVLDMSDQLKEPRERRGPTRPSPMPEHGMTRVVFGKMWLAAAGAFAVLGFVPLISLARKPGRRVLTGWRSGLRLVDEFARPITQDRLVAGGVETVFPEGAVGTPEGAAMLIRLSPDLYTAPGSNVGTTPDGYIAFSKICTHAGCPVALYRRQSHELYCPCHQSRFDVLNNCANISGPAPRPLPRLPIRVDADGYLVALGDFDAPVGPDDWDRVL